jgi:heme exporter protein CcmD
MNDDAHWSYILAAYAVTFTVVGAVVWRIVAEHRRLLAELAQLQDSGGDEV